MLALGTVKAKLDDQGTEGAAKAALPFYRRFIPRRTGRLAASARVVRVRNEGDVRIGEGLRYTGPVTFGWRRHGIEPHRWDLRARASAEAAARKAYEDELRRVIQRYG